MCRSPPTTHERLDSPLTHIRNNDYVWTILVPEASVDTPIALSDPPDAHTEPLSDEEERALEEADCEWDILFGDNRAHDEIEVEAQTAWELAVNQGLVME